MKVLDVKSQQYINSQPEELNFGIMAIHFYCNAQKQELMSIRIKLNKNLSILPIFKLLWIKYLDLGLALLGGNNNHIIIILLLFCLGFA